MNEHNKPLIIFDTDMDTDCDDVGALAMLLEAHRQEKIKLAGIITDSICKYAAPFCEAMNRYYGISIPIGAVREEDYPDSESNILRFGDYRMHSARCLERHGYNQILSEKIQKTDKDYPSAVSMYRTLLANASDKSVTVLCVGLLTGIAEALSSMPDEISPLSGVELFRQKVEKVITMGNPGKACGFNWGMDTYATEQFIALCPVPVLVSAEGTTVITGAHLSGRLECDHPLRRAYELWLRREHCGRESWDLIATLNAIRPDSPYLMERDLGACRFDVCEKRLYIDPVDDPQFRSLHINCEPERMVQLLNEYMLGVFDF